MISSTAIHAIPPRDAGMRTRTGRSGGVALRAGISRLVICSASLARHFSTVQGDRRAVVHIGALGIGRVVVR